MPTRQGGTLPKNSMICLRRSCRLTTTWPALSTPCNWNTFLARSTPMVLTCMWTTPSSDSLFNTLLARSMPGAGVVPPHHERRVLQKTVACQLLGVAMQYVATGHIRVGDGFVETAGP